MYKCLIAALAASAASASSVSSAAQARVGNLLKSKKFQPQKKAASPQSALEAIVANAKPLEHDECSYVVDQGVTSDGNAYAYARNRDCGLLLASAKLPKAAMSNLAAQTGKQGECLEEVGGMQECWFLLEMGEYFGVMADASVPANKVSAIDHFAFAIDLKDVEEWIDGQVKKQYDQENDCYYLAGQFWNHETDSNAMAMINYDCKAMSVEVTMLAPDFDNFLEEYGPDFVECRPKDLDHCSGSSDDCIWYEKICKVNLKPRQVKGWVSTPGDDGVFDTQVTIGN